MPHRLEHPDPFHLNAAAGWMGLRDFASASAELDSIRPSSQDHPAVLELRFAIAAHERAFADCERWGRHHAEVHPADAQGWINLANALFWQARYDEAHASAVAVLEKFPDQWPLRYNLACYCVKLNDLDQAKRWFNESAKLAEGKELRKLALNDPDMKELWDWVKKHSSLSDKPSAA